ncbi:glycosyltransferase family 61 protein [Gulosibacter sediminis]|uniref:glycosyltransferase family 61 protein n=1 Tax=Gulosibacter sediminis TaxID=1729695 RepID=UPI0024AC942C|nr:glycosyltransferase family 61 protein [Gulosibacter sediminis]
MDTYVAAGHIEHDNYRVSQGLSQIRDAESQALRLQKMIDADSRESLELLRGIPASLAPVGGLLSKYWGSTSAGLYQGRFATMPISRSMHDEHLSRKHRARLTSASFGLPPSDYVEDRVFVAHDVRLSRTGWTEATAIDADGVFHPTRSGRLPRLTGLVLVERPEREIEMVYILPFPYVSGNYYHSLTEMAYGLRHIYTVDADVPIVFEKDPFGFLPVICRAMGIDVSRLVSRESVQNAIFSTAVLPEGGPYYWSSTFVQFFRSIALQLRNTAAGASSSELIYVSRSKSQRSLPDEWIIENYLRSLGFEIFFAEEHSFEEQVDKFSCAQVIVASHGAGMANICFAPDDCRVLEIFLPELINRDFQRRSQFVTPNYYPMILDEGGATGLIEGMASLLEDLLTR